MARQCRLTRLTRAEVVVIVAMSLFLAAVLPLACRKARTEATKTLCASNLMLLGKAMLAYANDYDGKLPRAGGRNSEWGQPIWNAPDRYSAFGVTPATLEGGRATIGSCLYLLVKYAGVSPATFICPRDQIADEFIPSKYRDVPPDFKLADAWDFGPASGQHYSYAYHIPFGRHALTTSRDPGLAILADRNPWQMNLRLDRFLPDIPPYNGQGHQALAGNSTSHEQTGQNVLFLDGHVRHKERPFCALDNDNIYTASEVQDKGDPKGKPPVFSATLSPANARDSLLVQDPAPYVYQIADTKQAVTADSNDLHQTEVLATLDCPLPAGRNAIWCASFQMAWDEYKNRAVGKPIQVAGAGDLVGRLNNAEFPTSDIEEKSYYATVGSVNDAILETIQREMARRFPEATPPVFDDRYRTLPLVTVAYAYLTVDMDFKHPFRTNERPFAFTG